MNRKEQDLFYASIGKELTRCRERMKLNTSQLATKVGEQYNTIKAIEDGKPFMAHQLAWMKNITEMNLNILISDALSANNIKDEPNGDNKEETSNEADISLFI